MCKKETPHASKNYISLETILFNTLEETWLSVQWISLSPWGKEHMPNLGNVTSTNILQVHFQKGSIEVNGHISWSRCSHISI